MNFFYLGIHSIHEIVRVGSQPYVIVYGATEHSLLVTLDRPSSIRSKEQWRGCTQRGNKLYISCFNSSNKDIIRKKKHNMKNN